MRNCWPCWKSPTAKAISANIETGLLSIICSMRVVEQPPSAIFKIGMWTCKIVRWFFDITKTVKYKSARSALKWHQFSLIIWPSAEGNPMTTYSAINTGKCWQRTPCGSLWLTTTNPEESRRQAYIFSATHSQKSILLIVVATPLRSNASWDTQRSRCLSVIVISTIRT